jgi:hypothetical protein
MNVADENISFKQCQQLRTWGIPIRQIGVEIARKGIQDTDVIPLLLDLARPTLFTHDVGFWRASLCHQRYCLVFLAVERDVAAVFIRRLLRHPQFDTQAKRMGTIIRVSYEGLSVWQIHVEQEIHHSWTDLDGRPYPAVVREEESLYVTDFVDGANED